MTPDEHHIILAAEDILFRAQLSILEEEALWALRERPGLALAPLWPGSPMIQIVALDGTHLGRVRLEGPHYAPERWIAVPLLPKKSHGPYRSARAAAESLLVHKPSRRGRI